jgi:hypothetical protein
MLKELLLISLMFLSTHDFLLSELRADEKILSGSYSAPKDGLKYIKLKYKSRMVQVSIHPLEWETRTPAERDLLIKRYQLEIDLCDLLDVNLVGRGFYSFLVSDISPEQKAIRFLIMGYTDSSTTTSFFTGPRADVLFNNFIDKISRKKEKVLGLIRKCYANCPENSDKLPNIENYIEDLVSKQSEFSKNVKPTYDVLLSDLGPLTEIVNSEPNKVLDMVNLHKNLSKSEILIHKLLFDQNKSYKTVIEKINKGIDPNTIVRESGGSFVYFSNNALPSGSNIYKFKITSALQGEGNKKGGANPRVYFLYNEASKKCIIIHADYKKFVGPEKPKEVKRLIRILTNRLKDYSNNLNGDLGESSFAGLETTVNEPVNTSNESKITNTESETTNQNLELEISSDPSSTVLESNNIKFPVPKWIIRGEKIFNELVAATNNNIIDPQEPVVRFYFENLNSKAKEDLYKYFMQDHRLVDEELLVERFLELPFEIKEELVVKAELDITNNINAKLVALFHDLSPEYFNYEIISIDPYLNDGDYFDQDLKLNTEFYEADMRDVRWYNNYMMVRNYYIEHGKLPPSSLVVRDSEGKEIKLGLWLSNNIQFYNQGKLSKERFNKIGPLLEFYNDSKVTWGDWYNLFLQEITGNSGAMIDSEHMTWAPWGDYVKIGEWGIRQISLYKEGSLSSEKITLLESTPGWPWGRSITPSSPSSSETTNLEETEILEPKVEEPKIEEAKVEEAKVEEAKIQEPLVIDKNLTADNTSEQLKSFMKLAVELNIIVSDRVISKIQQMGPLDPEAWRQLYDLIMNEYLENNYCALCGSITQIFYSDLVDVPREIWEIIIDLMESESVDLEAKKILLEAIFSPSNNIIPSEFFSKFSDNTGLVGNWEGEVKRLLSMPDVNTMYPYIESNSVETSSEELVPGEPILPEAAILPEAVLSETSPVEENIEAPNSESSTNELTEKTTIDSDLKSRMNIELQKWITRIDGGPEVFVDAKTKSFKTIEELFLRGEISLDLLTFLLSHKKEKSNFYSIVYLAIVLVKLSNDPSSQIDYLKILENKLVKEPNNIVNFLSYSASIKPSNSNPGHIFFSLEQADIIKMFKTLSFNGLLSAEENKIIFHRLEENITADAINKISEKTRASLKEYTFKDNGPGSGRLSDARLVNSFLDKVYLDLQSENIEDFNFAMGMLLSLDNIKFIRNASSSMNLNTNVLLAYNALMDAVLDYRNIVSEKGFLNNHDAIFRTNDRALKVAKENIKITYTRYKALRVR